MSTLEELSIDYLALCNAPEDANAAWFRRRGYDFERLLKRLLDHDELDPRTSYKAPGEQIDGSFFLNGSVFLLEAKWHADPIPASTLYQFKGKVDGKLIGTIGVFISMSGYSQDAVDALSLGKSLNLILFDKRDMDAALIRRIGFKDVLKRKLRHAAEEGVVYFPTEMEVVTGSRSKAVEIEHLRYDAATDNVFANQAPSSALSDLIIICEGDTDREVITALAERILESDRSGRSIKIIPAMGKYPIPKVVNAVRSLNQAASKILIVVDGDGDPAASLEMLRKGIETDNWVASIPDPEIEKWIGIDRKSMQRRFPLNIRLNLYRKAVEELDIDNLRRQDQSFAAFYNQITGE